MTAVKTTYGARLVERSLGRLKMQVSLPNTALRAPNTEEGGHSVLLQAFPENSNWTWFLQGSCQPTKLCFDSIVCKFGKQVRRSSPLYSSVDA